jgi:hypothetical protein
VVADAGRWGIAMSEASGGSGIAEAAVLLGSYISRIAPITRMILNFIAEMAFGLPRSN